MDYSDEHKYEDIINMPHHVSASRPRMSMIDRAAQFSPFAALTGYDAAVKETARLTDSRIELDEYEKLLWMKKLRIALNTLRQKSQSYISNRMTKIRRCIYKRCW